MKKKIIYKSAVIFLVGLILSAFISTLVFDIESKTLANEIKKEMDQAAFSINKELNISNELLHSMRDHIFSGNHLNSPIFRKMAERIIDREPYIEIISIINYQQMKNNSLNLKIKFSYPNSGLSSLKTAYLPNSGKIHHALKKSLTKKVPIIIFNLLLNDLFDVNKGFFVIFPTTNNEKAIHHLFSDFILSFFSIDELVTVSAGKNLIKNMNLSLIEISENTYENRYNSIVDIYSYNNKPMLFESSPIYFAGKKWILTGIPTYEYLSKKFTNYSLIILLLGILIFTFISFAFYFIQMRLVHAYQLIENQAIKLKKLSSQLNRLNKKDKLTNFYYFGYFIKALDIEIKQAIKCKYSLSLILIEIDHADDFSKQKGTRETLALIKTISSEIKKSIPNPLYIISRYDHYKFSIIAPNLNDTSFIMRACLKAIRALNIELQNKKISVSLGSITLMDLSNVSSEYIINEAEKSLKRALSLGGDQYVQAIFNKITPTPNDEVGEEK